MTSPTRTNRTLGEHGPWNESGDDAEDDPEHLGDWRFACVIETIEGAATPAN